MNIVLTCLLSGVCGMVLVAIPFLLKYFCDISYSLRMVSHDLHNLSIDFDSYMHEFADRKFLIIKDNENEDL